VTGGPPVRAVTPETAAFVLTRNTACAKVEAMKPIAMYVKTLVATAMLSLVAIGGAHAQSDNDLPAAEMELKAVAIIFALRFGGWTDGIELNSDHLGNEGIINSPSGGYFLRRSLTDHCRFDLGDLVGGDPNAAQFVAPSMGKFKASISFDKLSSEYSTGVDRIGLYNITVYGLPGAFCMPSTCVNFLSDAFASVDYLRQMIRALSAVYTYDNVCKPATLPLDQ
jgi:hypothetical protein